MEKLNNLGLHFLNRLPRRFFMPRPLVVLCMAGLLVCLPCVYDANAQLGDVAQGASPLQQSPEDASTSPNQFGSISGHASRADTGAPLAKAIVTLNRVGVNPDDPLVMRTDPNGAYRFTALDPGTYTVTVHRAGFTLVEYGHDKVKSDGIAAMWVHIEPGQSLQGIDVSLPAGCPSITCPPTAAQNGVGDRTQPTWFVSGTILDEDGDPADGSVTAIRMQYLPSGDVLAFSEGMAPTDEQGNFRMTGTGTKSIYIAATGIGARGSSYTTEYYPDALSFDTAQKFQVSPGTEIKNLRVVIKTIPTYSISGKISVMGGGAVKQSYGILIRALGTDPMTTIRPRGPSDLMEFLYHGV
jgi:hypothetical protein